MSIAAVATKSFAEQSNPSQAEQLYQAIQAELKTSQAKLKNTVFSMAEFFKKPEAKVSADDFIYAHSRRGSHSTLWALIKTDDAVFSLRSTVSPQSQEPVIFLQELTAANIGHEIHQASGIARGRIITDMSPELALSILNRAGKKNLLASRQIHGEVFLELGLPERIMQLRNATMENIL